MSISVGEAAFWNDAMFNEHRTAVSRLIRDGLPTITSKGGGDKYKSFET